MASGRCHKSPVSASYFVKPTRLLCVGVTSTLVRIPSNKAVIHGSPVTFECSTDVKSSNPNFTVIRWFNSTCVLNRKYLDCRKELIYSGFSLANNVPPRFSVTPMNNATHVTRDLNINSTQLTDAGVYLCGERDFNNVHILDSSSAQLTVLGNYIGYA